MATEVKAPEAPAVEIPAEVKPLISASHKALKSFMGYETKRTAALKAFAETIVDLRSAIIDPKTGKADISGKTAVYKAAVAEVYAGVDIPADSADSVQASVRYHVGNVLRTRFKAEELTAVGLSAESPKDRLNRQAGERGNTRTPAEVKSAEVAAAAGENPPALPTDPTALVNGAMAFIRRAKLMEVPEDRTALRLALADLAAEVNTWQSTLAAVEAPAEAVA
jgi:hypothetical protein